MRKCFYDDLIPYFDYNDGVMEKSHFARQLWITFGVIAGSMAIAFGAFQFFSDRLTSQSAAIMNDRSVVVDNTDLVSSLAALRAQAALAEQYQAAMERLIPDQYGLVTFEQWFSDVGKQDGVVADASLQGSITPAQGSAPGSIQFAFTIDGPLNGVTGFLNDVNTTASGFIVSIGSFDVTANGASYHVAGQGTLFSR
jgi:hypothetical protein